jgi:hypothetical protein
LQTVRGASLQLTDTGLIAQHHDYWDAKSCMKSAADGGPLMRWLKKRANT